MEDRAELSKAEKDKISRNEAEDKSFSSKISDYLNGKLKHSEVIKIGTTPYSLRLVGASAIPLFINQNVLANSLGIVAKLSGHTKVNHTDPHDVGVNSMKKLPQAIRSPVCICKGNAPSTLVVVTDLTDKDNHYIVIPIKIDTQGLKSRINRVESVYGRKNIQLFIEKSLSEKRLLAVDIKKSNKCL